MSAPLSFLKAKKKNGIMVVICGSVHTLFFFSNAAAWGVMFQTLSLVLLSQAAEDTSRYLIKLTLKVWHSNENEFFFCHISHLY